MDKSTFFIQKSLIRKIAQQKLLQTYKGIKFKDKYTVTSNLSLEIYSHRLIFKSDSQKYLLINGDQILGCELKQSGIIFKQQFLELKIKESPSVQIYKDNSIKQIHLKIQQMSKNKQWENKKKPTEVPYQGFGHKLKDQGKKIKQKQIQVAESFDSFDHLFVNLKALKSTINEIKELTGQVKQQNTEVNKIVKDIGFRSIISKDQMGSQYEYKVAQDLYRICEKTLFQKFGGMISLLDLFYYYNKTRSSSLISPEQLLHICQKFEQFKFNAKLITYPKNIKMIESTQFDCEKDFQSNFNCYFSSFSLGHTADQIAMRKDIPSVIVEIKLKSAVQRGHLAIDDRIQGIKYYKNLILTI